MRDRRSASRSLDWWIFSLRGGRNRAERNPREIHRFAECKLLQNVTISTPFCSVQGVPWLEQNGGCGEHFMKQNAGLQNLELKTHQKLLQNPQQAQH